VRAPTALTLSVVLLAGCGDGGPSRSDAVGDLTEVAVPARFAELAAVAEPLPGDVAAWCAGGDATAITDVVAEVRTAWLATAPFWSGPVMERRSRFSIDPTPNPGTIDELVAGDQQVDATSLRELAGAGQRGLGAIEHLIVAAPTERTCAYATGAAELVAAETAAVAADWRTFGPSLAVDEQTANMALRDMVSDAIGALRIVKATPDAPGNEARVAGVRWLLLGDELTPGLAPLLSDATVEQLSAEFDAGAVGEYERTIASSVVGELGITVNFSDADGDG
jgi:predicted lipoprotein